MAKNLSPELTLYAEIVLTLLFVLAAGVLYAVLSRLVARTAARIERPPALLAARLALPAALLAVASVLKLGAVRRALGLRPGYNAVLDAAFVLFVIFLLVRLVDGIIRVRFAARQRPFPLPRVLHGFVLLVVYLAVILAVLKQVLAVNITPLLAGSAILTAVLGLALQGVLGNILAGMSLHYTKSFSRGDWVRVGETEGVVIDTNWRETRLIDRGSNVVVIPNNAVASQTITNFSLPDKRAAVTVPVQASFAAPPEAVLEAIVESAREVPDVLRDPAPTAYLLSYDEFGVSYQAKFWIADYARKVAAASDVARLIWYKFQRQGFEIPVPFENKISRVLKFLRPEDRIAELTVEREKSVQEISRSSFLRIQEGERAGETALSDSEVRELASKARRVKFAAREVLFRQGEGGETCFLVAGGRVRGEIVYEEGGRTFTSDFEIGPGGIVGEMSVFTGMPRTATVSVVEEAELIEIRAEVLAGLLARNPALAEALAEIVSGRNRANLETLRKIKELAAGEVEASADKSKVLEYLKRLVHLFKIR